MAERSASCALVATDSGSRCCASTPCWKIERWRRKTRPSSPFSHNGCGSAARVRRRVHHRSLTRARLVELLLDLAAPLAAGTNPVALKLPLLAEQVVAVGLRVLLPDRTWEVGGRVAW